MDHSDLESRIAGLSPAKRALLERWWSDKVATDETDPIRPRSSDANLPLSFSQRRLWFLDHWEPGNPAYNSYRVFELEGPLDITALQSALTEISNRHESLRTTFSSGPDGPVQIVHPPGPFEIRYLAADTAADTDDKKWAQALSVAEQETTRPFNLATGPLLRASLSDLQPQRYLLVLTIHHIIADGWSMGLLYQELFTMYEEFADKRSCSLPTLPIQYADFAIWQRRRLQGEFFRTQVSYWQEQLRDLSTLELPTDHARPAIQTFSGAIHHIHLPQHLLDGLLSISRRQGATLFLTLLAGFQVLLHRYTGQNDIAVGSPIAGRTHVALERLIGCFVNILVLRGDIAGNPTFLEFLKRVEKIALEAYSHQVIPFERLVEELHPHRDASRNPLFQVAFALQNAPRPVVSLSRLKVTAIQMTKSPIRFDLEVHIREVVDGLDGLFIYNTALFQQETIVRMAQHYRSVLEGIAANPDQRVSELPLLVEAERQQLLVEWNQTDSKYPRDVCIQTLFEARAQASPAAAAIVWGKASFTYRQLNEQANSLANHLCTLGVGPDALVAVCLERSIEMIVACLAILKAGGAYVPLEPSYPRERLAFMLRDANAPVLITTTRLQAILPETSAQIVYVDKERFKTGNRSNPNSGATADNLAYVMYTSGSTGQPKGVSVSHRAVVRLVINSNYVQLSAADRIAQVSNVTFDAATFEIWGALLNGATLVGVPQAVLLSPKNFAKLIPTEGITILFLTTALFNVVASESPTTFRTLRYLLFGGQSCDPKWVRVILEHGPPQNLLHVYGPTECTTFTTCYRVERVDDSATTIPIGRPISGTRVYILDSQLRPVPARVAGELCVGGDGLACEYLNRPELTAEKFIAAAFNGEMQRIYKTGDLARYLPDGNIEFIGRIDRQVKIRGFRIELQEIEAVLSQYPSVANCFVIAKQKDQSDHRLHAYIVPEDGARPDTETLRRYLRDKLPEYMLPAAFVILDSLPLNPNGKVDHTRLPEPAEIMADDIIERVGPRTWIEAALAGIWTELLGLNVVSVHESFFDLGGHSLLAVQLIARIEKTFRKTLPVAILFRSPTIAQLAELLSTHDDTEAWSSLLTIQPNGGHTPFFWIHGDSSNVWLPAVLGSDQPIYGFEHQGEDGRRAVHTEVDTMAEHYLNGLRTIRPHGPYLLGGYSFGAVLAYEIAQRLRSRGEQVPLLFMLDPPGKARETVLRPSFRLELRRHGSELKPLGARGSLDYLLPRVKGRINGRISPIVKTLRKIRWKFHLAAGLIVPVALRSPYILDVYRQALRRYRPQQYSGPATILRSKGGPYESPLDWPKLISGTLEICEVFGEHMDLKKAAYVTQWAEYLCKSLERAHQSCTNGKG